LWGPRCRGRHVPQPKQGHFLSSLTSLGLVPAITLSFEIIDCLSIDLLLISYANYASSEAVRGSTRPRVSCWLRTKYNTQPACARPSLAVPIIVYYVGNDEQSARDEPWTCPDATTPDCSSNNGPRASSATHRTPLLDRRTRTTLTSSPDSCPRYRGRV
jgi:hypothetical protein